MSQSQQATVSSLSPCGKAVVTWKVLGVGLTWQSISLIPSREHLHANRDKGSRHSLFPHHRTSGPHTAVRRVELGATGDRRPAKYLRNKRSR
jgi:hypothetical protein